MTATRHVHLTGNIIETGTESFRLRTTKRRRNTPRAS
jgi:hypothetical protein